MNTMTRQGTAPCFLILLAMLPVWACAGARSLWTEAYSPATRNTIYAVDYTDRTDAWAVGDTGTILRLVDGKWENFTSGTDEDLLGLVANSKDDAWAVGDNGTILHFDGKAWRPDAASKTATLLPLRAVAFINPSNGWAVGGRFAEGLAAPMGVVLRYDGSSWISATVTSEPLFDLALNASDDIHICGGNRTLMRFDGSEFRTVSSPIVDTGTWRSMAFPFRTQGWVVGDGGKIAKFAVGAWTEQPSPTTSDLHDLVVLSEALQGLAVGANGVRLNFEMGAFIPEPEGDWTMSHSEFYGAALANELEGVAVGGTEYVAGAEAARSARIFMLRRLTEEQALDNIRVYPNPFNPGADLQVSFDKLPADVTLMEISTLIGQVVAKIGEGIQYQPLTGVANWDGRLASGKLAASGPYILRVETASGFRRKAVFLVRRR